MTAISNGIRPPSPSLRPSKARSRSLSRSQASISTRSSPAKAKEADSRASSLSRTPRASYLPPPTNADQQKKASLLQRIREQDGWSDFPDELPLNVHHSRAKSPQFEIIMLTAFLRLSKLCSDFPHALDRLQSLYSSQVHSGTRVSLQSIQDCYEELEAELAEGFGGGPLDDEALDATDDEEDTALVKEEHELEAPEQLLRGRRIGAAVIYNLLAQIVSLSVNSQYRESWNTAQYRVDEDVDHVYHAHQHPGSDAWTLLLVDMDSRVATCYDWLNDPGGVPKVQEVSTKLLFDFGFNIAWEFEDLELQPSHRYQGGLPVIVKVLSSFTTLNGLASVKLWREVLAAFVDDTLRTESDVQDVDVDMASDTDTIDAASDAASNPETIPELTHSGIEKDYDTADSMKSAVKDLIAFFSSIRVNTADAVPTWTERRRVLLEQQRFQREDPLLDCTADSDLLASPAEARLTEELLSIVTRSLDDAVAARRGLRRAECMLHYKLDRLSTVMLEVAASEALSIEAVQIAALSARRAREKLQAAMSAM